MKVRPNRNIAAFHERHAAMSGSALNASARAIKCGRQTAEITALLAFVSD